jgi:hypothetical protein
MSEGVPRITSDEITDDLDVAVEIDSERCLRLLLFFATSSCILEEAVVSSSMLIALASELVSGVLRRWLFDRRVETMNTEFQISNSSAAIVLWNDDYG